MDTNKSTILYGGARKRKQSKSIFASILTGLFYGIIIALIIITIWWVWAITSYKTSEERLGALMLTKHNIKNKKDLDKTQMFKAVNIDINPTQTKTSADMQIVDKSSQRVEGTTSVEFIIEPDCKPTDPTCIKL